MEGDLKDLILKGESPSCGEGLEGDLVAEAWSWATARWRARSASRRTK
jgi:hypothetical protein